MLFIIRTDSSRLIGSGHVMRCLVLAEKLRSENHTVIFMSRDHQGNINDLVQSKNFSLITLTSRMDKKTETSPTWLGVSQEKDAEECITLLKEKSLKPDWIIIDHYEIDAVWHQSLRPHTQKICVIDDLGKTLKDCDILVDQNINNPAHDQHKTTNRPETKLALGPEFGLISPAFNLLREKSLKRQRWPIRTILVTMGGVDFHNDTEKVLRSFRGNIPSDVTINIVIGGKNPNKDRLQNLIDQMSNTTLYVQTSEMAKLMYEADLAFTAGGTTSWEKCVMGLPSIVTVQADNQKNIANKLDRAGAHIIAGESTHISPENYAAIYNKLTQDHLLKMSVQCSKICDGKGADKIYNLLINH